MSYIGATPVIGNFQKCDAITTSATDTFNILVGGVAVSPATPQNCIVSLNGVIQAPVTAYTLSGSTIVFASALTTSDVIDFIVILGNVLDIGTPSDDTVTAAKLNDTAISGQTALGAEPADTDEFLVSDAGVLKRMDYSYIKAPAASGAWTKIESQTASSDATIQFTTLSTDYRDFRLIGSAVVPTSDGQDCQFQIRVATAWITSGYTYALYGSDEDGSLRNQNNTSGSQILLNSTALGNNNGENIYFVVTIADVHSTSNQKEISIQSCYSGWTNKYEQLSGGGRNNDIVAVDGVRIKFGSGDVSSGELTLYGRKVT